MKIAGIGLFIVWMLISGYLGFLYQHREFSPIQQEQTFLLDRGFLPPLAEPEQKEVQRILSQSFSYLDRGKQMTAYVSLDGEYVLKLFHPRPPLRESDFHSFKNALKLLSMKWISSAFLHKKERLLRLYDRYALAFREMKEEAALVYVHVCPSELRKRVVIKDQNGTCYDVEIGQTPFVLQRKAEIAQARLRKKVSEKNAEGVRACIHQLRELFKARAKKGITDRIQTLHNNYGFIGERAVQIDLGRVRWDACIARDPDAEVERIMKWVEETYLSVN